jgi:hypothetical protein
LSLHCARSSCPCETYALDDFFFTPIRLAIARATMRDVAAVKKARDLVDGLMGLFLQVRE